MQDLPGYLTPKSRRALLALAAGLTTRRTEALGRDRALLFACGQFNRLERGKLALFEGPDRIAYDEERDKHLQPLVAKQLPLLDAICDTRANSLTAHRARAASFMLWDGGELAWRAATSGYLEDRLLSALMRDLVGDTVAP